MKEGTHGRPVPQFSVNILVMPGMAKLSEAILRKYSSIIPEPTRMWRVGGRQGRGHRKEFGLHLCEAA